MPRSGQGQVAGPHLDGRQRCPGQWGVLVGIDPDGRRHFDVDAHPVASQVSIARLGTAFRASPDRLARYGVRSPIPVHHAGRGRDRRPRRPGDDRIGSAEAGGIRCFTWNMARQLRRSRPVPRETCARFWSPFHVKRATDQDGTETPTPPNHRFTWNTADPPPSQDTSQARSSCSASALLATIRSASLAQVPMIRSASLAQVPMIRSASLAQVPMIRSASLAQVPMIRSASLAQVPTIRSASLAQQSYPRAHLRIALSRISQPSSISAAEVVSGGAMRKVPPSRAAAPRSCAGQARGSAG